MRLASLLSEAWRNVVSGTTRAGLIGTVFTALLCALTLADAVTISALLRDADEFQNKGASTVTVVAPGAISGAACEALTQIDGVAASGAVRSTQGTLSLTVLPRSPIALRDATNGFVKVIGASRFADGGVVVSNDVASSAGLREGEAVDTDRGQVAIRGVYDYPSDGRRPGFGWTALVPVAATGDFDECWLTVWPWNDRVQAFVKGLVISTGASASENPKITQSQLNTQLGMRFQGAERYVERATRYLPYVAFFLGMVVSALAVRMRRLELAARLHDGASRADLLAQVLVEAAAWIVPATLIAWAAAILYPHLASTPAVQDFGTAQYAAALAGLLGAFAGTLSATALVRERHLFAYFKDR